MQDGLQTERAEAFRAHSAWEIVRWIASPSDVCASAMADAAALGAMSLDEAPEEKETVVDPWTVTGKVDYAKLIRDFG